MDTETRQDEPVGATSGTRQVVPLGYQPAVAGRSSSAAWAIFALVVVCGFAAMMGMEMLSKGLGSRLWVVLGIPALIYGGGPLAVWLTMRFNCATGSVLLGVEDLPPEAYAHFAATAPGLARSGFAVAAYLRLGEQVVGTGPSYVALWVNRAAGDGAAALVAAGQEWVEYSTEWPDGSRVETANCRGAGVFAGVPHRDTLRVSEIRDAEALYRLHRHRVLRGATVAVPALPEPGQEAVDFIDSMARDMDHQVTAGYYRRRPDSMVYRPTLRGAFLMTWALLPPMKQVRQSRQRRKAREELARARMAATAP